jgi:DNA repair protein RadC
LSKGKLRLLAIDLHRVRSSVEEKMGSIQSMVASRIARGRLVPEGRTAPSRAGANGKLCHARAGEGDLELQSNDTSQVTLRDFLAPASHRTDEALELLTRMLRYAVGDSAPTIARELLEQAVTLPGVLVTPGYQVRSMTGDEKVADFFDLLVRSFNHTMEVGLRAPSVHPTAEQVRIFLLNRLNHEKVEVLYALFFGANGSLIHERELARGNSSACLPCPREIARTALSIGAAAIVLAHNHPSGSPQPSNEDVRFSAQVAASLSLADAVLVDHLIISNGISLSMRQLGLLPKTTSNHGLSR